MQLTINFHAHRKAYLEFNNHEFCLDCGSHWYNKKYFTKEQWNKFVKDAEKASKKLDSA